MELISSYSEVFDLVDATYFWVPPYELIYSNFFILLLLSPN